MSFVQFLTFYTGFGPELIMHLVPAEDVETVGTVTKLFVSGDHDCSAGQTKDDKAIEAALGKSAPSAVHLVNETGTRDDSVMPFVPSLKLPEGHSIVRVVARYVPM